MDNIPIPVVIAILKYGGPVAAGVLLGFIPWWFARKDNRELRSVIAEKDRQIVELARESGVIATNAQTTTASLLEVLSSRSSRR